MITKEEAARLTKGNNFWAVLVYAEWDNYCQAYFPFWDAAAHSLQGLAPTGRVNSAKEGKLAVMWGDTEKNSLLLPTVAIVRDGDVHATMSRDQLFRDCRERTASPFLILGLERLATASLSAAQKQYQLLMQADLMRHVSKNFTGPFNSLKRPANTNSRCSRQCPAACTGCCTTPTATTCPFHYGRR